MRNNHLDLNLGLCATLLCGLVLATITNCAWADEGVPGQSSNHNSSVKTATTLPLALRAKLESLRIPLDAVTLVVKPVGSNAPLLAVNDTVLRNPASVMKMVTTYAALKELGPGYQWKLEVRRTGLISNGVLDGDLILVGHGDPLFLKQDLWSLVNQLESRDIKSINGDLIIDSTYFDLPSHDPSEFDGEEFRPYNAGPSATLFNFNAMNFFLVPVKNKRYVDVRVTTPVEGMRVESAIKQVDGTCRGSKINLRMAVEQQEEIKVVSFRGSYPSSCGRYQLTRSVLDSHETIYGMLKEFIGQRGGELSGGLLIGAAPSDSSKLFTLSSETLSEVIRSTNKFSNNVMSRQLYLTLGAEKIGQPATLEKAQRALMTSLQSEGIDTTGLLISNGSGLCRECLISATTLMQLLDAAWRSPYMPEYIASLAVPGVDGSLKKRFPKGRYKGRIHMKTGTIDHVAAAAGYVQTVSNERFSFVLLMNHENIHKGKGLAFQRKLMSWLVTLES